MVCMRLEVRGEREWKGMQGKEERRAGMGIYVAKGYKERILWLVLYWFLSFFIVGILYNLL